MPNHLYLGFSFIP